MFSDHYQYHQNQYQHHVHIAEDDDVTLTSDVTKIKDTSDSGVTSDGKDTSDSNNKSSDINITLDTNSTHYRPFLCLALKDGYDEIVHSIYNLTILFTTTSSESKENDKNYDINTDYHNTTNDDNIQNSNIISINYNIINHQIDLS